MGLVSEHKFLWTTRLMFQKGGNWGTKTGQDNILTGMQLCVGTGLSNFKVAGLK